MTVPFVWLPSDPGQPTSPVVQSMERAMRVHSGQKSFSWSAPGLGVGVLESDPCGTLPSLDPVRVGDHFFWMFGEVFAGGKITDVGSVGESREPAFRRRLFEALRQSSFGNLASLDGEYVLFHWDAQERALTIANDRFGGLPLYWAESPVGLAVAGGVRGVLMAPGIEAQPDLEAIREAVTFGGFRLADRTNIEAVKMLPGGTILTCRPGSLARRRYWSFGDIAPRKEEPREQLLREAEALWTRAIGIRLDGCERPGQTLSGGLDSRAILAEAAPRTPSWTAITYGVPGCDDARIAERAARESGSRWRFVHLYDGVEDWLSSRSHHIQSTDGLIALGDLMHVEIVSAQAEEIHVHYSGYIGDAVCGPTFAEIERVEDLYRTLPYYGTGLGMTGAEAHERILALIAALDGAPIRYAVYTNKLPQATNRWTAAWRPWIRVRKPFVDYELLDFWLGLPTHVRLEDRLYERLLRGRYPQSFASIPHQKTGVPVLTSRWRWQAVRAARYAGRKLRRAMGLRVRPRAYHDDLGHAKGEIRAHIEEAILRHDSICCELLGRTRVATVVRDWFERAAAPEQVVGALYVYECYHRGLSAHLRGARTL